MATINKPFTIFAARTECAKIADANDGHEREMRFWRAVGYITALRVHQLIDADTHEELMALCGAGIRESMTTKPEITD